MCLCHWQCRTTTVNRWCCHHYYFFLSQKHVWSSHCNRTDRSSHQPIPAHPLTWILITHTCYSSARSSRCLQKHTHHLTSVSGLIYTLRTHSPLSLRILQASSPVSFLYSPPVILQHVLLILVLHRFCASITYKQASACVWASFLPLPFHDLLAL